MVPKDLPIFCCDSEGILICLIDELAWFAAHASHHVWQVNYLFEAAMFGSIFDDGGLKGRLDRIE